MMPVPRDTDSGIQFIIQPHIRKFYIRDFITLKNMKNLLTTLFLIISLCAYSNPVHDMLERIDEGASSKFVLKLSRSDKDFFELDQKGKKIVVRGNSYVNIATGVNWYLKYYAGIHLSWNCMHADLPENLPPVKTKERHETPLQLRYDFNYCTFSYSMPFWDWDRWEAEIDWMALHGVNLPLAAVGAECVWKAVLERLGYSQDEIGRIIAGPAFLAWFEMNNIEGWGGPLPDSWYARAESLQKKILARMKEWGMEPVLPGYSGMVPHDAAGRLGLDLAEVGPWNALQRPAFLMPTDPHFAEIAAIYYEEQQRLFGKADYYSMDPFHESSTGAGVDLAAAGQAVMAAMKRVNPKAVWVLQAWSQNPRDEMIEALGKGDLLILDLFSECRPMWGMESIWRKEQGYRGHEWLFCMLENFGGRVGLHGRMDQLIENFYLTKSHPMAKDIRGTGFSMEGGQNNPVMFELMSELPWRKEIFSKEDWIKEYCFARYGVLDADIEAAWAILAQGIYNCPRGNNQQGCHESIFCARPGTDVFWVYERSKLSNYYDPQSTRKAAELMLRAASRLEGNDNYEYDLVDIVRQALADHARVVYQRCMAGYKSFCRSDYQKWRDSFLNLLLCQDELLGSRKEFMLGEWLRQAHAAASNPDERTLYEWNARVQITTWGNRDCANDGKLHEYAHKEWNGILKDFYLPRWELFFKNLDAAFDGKAVEPIDWYAVEEPWSHRTDPYPCTPLGPAVSTARRIYSKVFE